MNKNITNKLALLCALATVFLFLQSCSKNSDASSTQPTTLTLYDTLGGTTKVVDPTKPTDSIEKGRLALRSVVDSAIFVIAADTNLNSYFTVLLAEVTAGNLSGFQMLSKNLTDFFCVATGAKNYTYTGDNMKDAHDPAKNNRMAKKANSTDFDRFVQDVVVAANKNKVPANIISRLGTIIYSVEAQVVQR